jgi:hypothetical protein
MDKLMPVKPKGHAGPGRPKGRKNNSTIEKERRIRRELAKVKDELSHEQIDQMDGVDTLIYVMRCYLRSQNLAGAASIARDLAPFQRPKVASMSSETPLPEDLEPDVPAQPDFDAQTGDGPTNPIP